MNYVRVNIHIWIMLLCSHFSSFQRRIHQKCATFRADESGRELMRMPWNEVDSICTASDVGQMLWLPLETDIHRLLVYPGQYNQFRLAATL